MYNFVSYTNMSNQINHNTHLTHKTSFKIKIAANNCFDEKVKISTDLIVLNG